MSFVTIGPDLTIRPKHREITLSITTDVSAFIDLSVDVAGLTIVRSPIRCSPGVAANVDCIVTDSNKTYTVTASNSATGDRDSCTVEVESIYTSYDLKDIRETLETCLESLTPSYRPEEGFRRDCITMNEFGVNLAQSRAIYIEIESEDEGSSPDIHKLTWSLYIGYIGHLYDSDLVEIRNHLNNYDWPAGITLAWCPSIVRTELAEEIPAALATLNMEVFS